MSTPISSFNYSPCLRAKRSLAEVNTALCTVSMLPSITLTLLGVELEKNQATNIQKSIIIIENLPVSFYTRL